MSNLENKNITSEETNEVNFKEMSFGQKIVYGLKYFLNYLKLICFDIYTSYKYNHMKIASTFILLPAILIGLVLDSHADAVLRINEDVSGFSASVGIYLFAIVLLGCINIFNSFSLNGKKNLFSAVFNAVTNVLLITFGVLYISSFLVNWSSITTSSSIYISIICVIISLLSGLAGTILSFFFIDWSYNKKDRL